MAGLKLHLTLRQRIYLSMISLILLSFLVSGITAFFNFKTQEEEYNIARLSRKELAVQESMRYYLELHGNSMAVDSVRFHFEDKINELSDIHKLAINMYNLKGELILSSSPENLSKLGFSQKIDYTILKQLSTGNARAEIAKDIDHGTFVMAYWYFTDEQGRPLAITNVRYDKQEIDSAELQAFLGSLAKIYLILFIGASLLAFVLSNYITSSLLRVGRLMTQSDLESGLEPIQWEAKDEIGSLVEAYNQMLNELQQAAEKLAKSERESAWREMAKQVAHEIKNPLTPMKLRVQHLQRSLKSDDPEYDAKLRSFVDSMIEQIQSLAKIASEFSDFAKMPRANEEKLNLVTLIENAVDLHNTDESANISFRLLAEGDKVEVHADKEQLLRVLNNLISNALQAMPEGRKAQIEIALSVAEPFAIIEVLDNGSGIPDDMKDKIFVPSFTTKSTGAGLGLAIVRNIVMQAGGEISFSSELNKGSRFTVKIPLLTT